MNSKAVVIEPINPASASVIWLHGLGANGHDFEPIVPQISKEVTCQTRFIFPHAANRQIPIFMAHGQYDPVISIVNAEHSRTKLEKLGYNVEWHSYNMQHNICNEEIAEISRWLSACLL